MSRRRQPPTRKGASDVNPDGTNPEEPSLKVIMPPALEAIGVLTTWFSSHENSGWPATWDSWLVTPFRQPEDEPVADAESSEIQVLEQEALLRWYVGREQRAKAAALAGNASEERVYRAMAAFSLAVVQGDLPGAIARVLQLADVLPSPREDGSIPVIDEGAVAVVAACVAEAAPDEMKQQVAATATKECAELVGKTLNDLTVMTRSQSVAYRETAIAKRNAWNGREARKMEGRPSPDDIKELAAMLTSQNPTLAKGGIGTLRKAVLEAFEARGKIVSPRTIERALSSGRPPGRPKKSARI